MLTKESAEAFATILSNENDTLSTISSRFNSTLDTRDRMVSLTGISMLLADGLLTHPQQIVALWLLYSEFSTIPVLDSPFLPTFVFLYNEIRTSNPNFCPPQLYDILNCILSNSSIELVGNLSVKSIISLNFSLPTPPATNISVPKQYIPRNSPILSEPIENPENPLSPIDILIDLLTDSTIYSDFEPPYIRPAPEILPVFAGELQNTFISSYNTSPALFDEYVSVNTKESAVALLQKAKEVRLSPAEIDSLLKEIKKNPDLSTEAGLSSEGIESLIELNPQIAQEVVLYLAQKDPQILDRLACTPITQSVADVAKIILSSPDLQESQFEQFIYKSMAKIQEITNQQIYMKKVSLFCGLLCDVFSDGNRSTPANLLVDLYSFCVDQKNESIKESQELAARLSA